VNRADASPHASAATAVLQHCPFSAVFRVERTFPVHPFDAFHSANASKRRTTASKSGAASHDGSFISHSVECSSRATRSIASCSIEVNFVMLSLRLSVREGSLTNE